jgi:hypothetical protein
MTRKVARSSWLAVAPVCLGLLDRHAAAYTIGTQIFSEGLAGSYTELDYGDIYEGAFYAYVDLTLSFDGNEVYESDARTTTAMRRSTPMKTPVRVTTPPQATTGFTTTL